MASHPRLSGAAAPGRVNPRAGSATAVLLAVAGLLVGCATARPTPPPPPGLTAVHALVADTARLYAIPPPEVLVAAQPAGIGGSTRAGVIILSPGVLTSRHRDPVVAHELAHVVLGHSTRHDGLAPETPPGGSRLRAQHELEANAKAVEILQRVRGMTELEALRAVYQHLSAVHMAEAGTPAVDSFGHLSTCEEIVDLFDRFPRHRPWQAPLECSGAEPVLGRVRDLHAGALEDLGRQRFETGLARAREALAILEVALGPDHLALGSILVTLGRLEVGQGRYGNAEPLYRRALAVREGALGPEHTDVAATLGRLGLLYWIQRRHREAEPLYQRAVAIWERVPGPELRDLVAGLDHLAVLYASERRYGEAEPLYRRALALREEALGRDHPDVAGRLHALATALHGQGKSAEAVDALGRAVAIYERAEARSPEHLPRHRAALEYLAAVYKALGRAAEADAVAARAAALGTGP